MQREVPESQLGGEGNQFCCCLHFNFNLLWSCLWLFNLLSRDYSMEQFPAEAGEGEKLLQIYEIYAH
jgi:hypothetical protein